MVDDEPKNLLALEAVLESLDLDLIRAHSGTEALRCLLKDDVAVILMDVQMPGMDGFETAALIRTREKNRNSPIIFLTAVGKTETEMFRGYEVGAVDYLLKPFSPEILRSKVRVLVELKQKSDEIEFLNQRLKEANADLERRVHERTASLEERSKDLDRSNQELAQFAAVASHDLQEPLRTLSTYLQLLEKNSPGIFKDESRQFFEIVLDSAKRMHQLINDLLSFSQVGGGERRLEKVDCALLVNKILAELKELIEEKGATISVGVMPALPAEPILLTQVFQNLIGNALKFHSGPGAKVEVSAEDRGYAWVFKIKDNGIGIDAEHFDTIFKLFKRLHSRDEYSGNGLGLSICKKVVERHGGEIWVESTPGLGSTFYFSIPCKG